MLPPAFAVNTEMQYEGDCKTAVVCGVARSGTSMAAVVVDALGVPMATDELLRTYCEDSSIVRGAQTDRAKAICKRSEESIVWGFKDPHVYNNWPAPHELHNLLRNPFYIIMFRNVAAMAMRETNIRQEV